MQEFSAISVSSYEAGSLADQLTEQSRDGWSVVAIVPTGSTVTAYLCRESDGPVAAPATTEEPAPEPAATDTEPVLSAATPMVPSTDEPASEPAPEPAAAEVTPAAGGDPAASTDTAATGAAAASTTSTANAAPAGWYADPSGRFELRYWDGGQWTEHVSRAGQQYTDPPVA